MAQFDVKMVLDKDTKNAVRYKEVVADGAAELVGMQYIKKAAFEGKPPEGITLTVTY